MPEQGLMGGWNGLAEVDPDESAVLAERLRLVAESLNAEFRGLSRADAQQVVFIAAQEVLSSASVVQFVPTFAERRARLLLHSGYSVSDPDAATDTLDTTPSAAAAPDPPSTPVPSAAPEVAPTHTLAPPWPDAFYASEAKRLLERARNLRAASLASLQPDSLA